MKIQSKEIYAKDLAQMYKMFKRIAFFQVPSNQPQPQHLENQISQQWPPSGVVDAISDCLMAIEKWHHDLRRSVTWRKSERNSSPFFFLSSRSHCYPAFFAAQAPRVH